MKCRIIIEVDVPNDLRMSPSTVEGIVDDALYAQLPIGAAHATTHEVIEVLPEDDE